MSTRATKTYNLSKKTIRSGYVVTYKATSNSGFAINGDGIITVDFNFNSTPNNTVLFSREYPSGSKSNTVKINKKSFSTAIIFTGTGQYTVNIQNNDTSDLILNSGTIEVTT
ncbi:MAG: hypothetical protein RR048_01900 [Oscillospiraceae bacterium]